MKTPKELYEEAAKNGNYPPWNEEYSKYFPKYVGVFRITHSQEPAHCDDCRRELETE